MKKYLETNDNEHTMTQNLWDAAKAVLRGKFISIKSYLKKQETSQINNVTLHLKQLEKEEKKKTKVRRRKESIKIISEINEKEMKEMIAKINKTKSWLFEKINKIDKPLARFIKKKREKTQINRSRNEKGEVTTDTAEIQRIMRDYYKQLYANKMDNLEEMDKLLEMHNILKLNQEEMENMIRPITSTEIETVIKNFPKNKSPGQDDFTGKFYQTFREKLTPILLKLFQNNTERRTFPNSFYDVTITLIPKLDKDVTKEENYRATSLMNIDANNLHKILANRIQQHFKRIIQHDQVGFISGMQGFFYIIHKSNNVIHHINKLKEENDMITSIDAANAFDKIQHPFKIKTLQKVGIERAFLNIIVATYDKPTTNIVLNGEKLKPFPVRPGTREGCSFSQLLFNIVLEVVTTTIREEKEIKESKSEKKK